MACEEHCEEYWLKELQKSMDRCTDRRDTTEMLLKTALNSIQSSNQSNALFIIKKMPPSKEVHLSHALLKEGLMHLQKGFDSGQPARNAQADLNRHFLI